MLAEAVCWTGGGWDEKMESQEHRRGCSVRMHHPNHSFSRHTIPMLGCSGIDLAVGNQPAQWEVIGTG